MTWEIWLAYTVACSVLLVIPGPTILLVISYALREGRSAAGWLAFGVVGGDFAAMVLSLGGMGLLLSVSSVLFSVVKWIGAAYLVYLGIRMWRAEPAEFVEKMSLPAGAGPRLARQAFLVTLFNPKGIIFFLAFFPQFLNHAAPLWPQMLILGTTFLVLGFLNAIAYGLLAGSAKASLQNPAWQRVVNRMGGSFLIGAGTVTAALQQR